MQYNNFINLAEIALTDAEKDILCRGLRCGISPVIKKDNIFAEFELAWQQLPKSTLSKSKEKERECMAGLSYVAHRFANTKVDCTGFRLSNWDITAIKPLKNNKDTIITKPHKGNVVVLLKRTEYVRKMQPILQDTSKFCILGRRMNAIEQCSMRKHYKRSSCESRREGISHMRFMIVSDQVALPDHGCMASKNTQGQCTFSPYFGND